MKFAWHKLAQLQAELQARGRSMSRVGMALVALSALLAACDGGPHPEPPATVKMDGGSPPVSGAGGSTSHQGSGSDGGTSNAGSGVMPGGADMGAADGGTKGCSDAGASRDAAAEVDAGLAPACDDGADAGALR